MVVSRTMTSSGGGSVGAGSTVVEGGGGDVGAGSTVVEGGGGDVEAGSTVVEGGGGDVGAGSTVGEGDGDDAGVDVSRVLASAADGRAAVGVPIVSGRPGVMPGVRSQADSRGRRQIINRAMYLQALRCTSSSPSWHCCLVHDSTGCVWKTRGYMAGPKLKIPVQHQTGRFQIGFLCYNEK